MMLTCRASATSCWRLTVLPARPARHRVFQVLQPESIPYRYLVKDRFNRGNQPFLDA